MPGDAFAGSLQVDFNQARVNIVGDDTLFADVILGDSLNLQVGNLTLISAPDAIGTFSFRDSSRGDSLLFTFQLAAAPGSQDLFQVEFLFEDFSGTFFDVGAKLLPDAPSLFDRAMLRIFPFDPGTQTFGSRSSEASARRAFPSPEKPPA